MSHPLVEFSLLAFGSLFAIVNPVAATPAFLAMTAQNTTAQRLRMAATASMVCAGVLVSFAALGQSIFRVFGITLPAFQIAGGLILLLVSLDSLRAKRSPVQETPEEKEEGIAKEDIAVTPLAVPMLSGPGAITTVILLESRARGWAEHAVLYLAIAAVSALSYLILAGAARGAPRLSPIAMNVTSRLMGLLLAATAVQFILSGIAPSLASR